MNFDKNIDLSIDGVGIVIYSDLSMKYVEEGDNFFEKEFELPEQVSKHIKKGDITAFCTGSSGDYQIRIRYGYPDNKIENDYPIAIRLALDVKGDTVSFVDLYWLMDWSKDVPDVQKIHLEEGYYHLTVLTKKPSSGIWGDGQVIYIFFNRLYSMPLLLWDGVPQLFDE